MQPSIKKKDFSYQPIPKSSRGRSHKFRHPKITILPARDIFTLVHPVSRTFRSRWSTDRQDNNNRYETVAVKAMYSTQSYSLWKGLSRLWHTLACRLQCRLGVIFSLPASYLGSRFCRVAWNVFALVALGCFINASHSILMGRFFLERESSKRSRKRSS